MSNAKKAGRPPERGETYRFSLYLDGDLEQFIKDRSWEKHKTVTQYLNDLVRKDMEVAANEQKSLHDITKRSIDAIADLRASRLIFEMKKGEK